MSARMLVAAPEEEAVAVASARSLYVPGTMARSVLPSNEVAVARLDEPDNL